MNILETHRSFGGDQLVVEHASDVLGCTMRAGIYVPASASASGGAPVLVFLSGLTCNEQNAITKAGLQRACAEHGLILVTPDTSPRGEGVADSPDWDLGQGAGFYLSATEEPWREHYRMDRYVLDELPTLWAEHTRSPAVGITGHSMGGHGAITLALRQPGRYRSVSAFAPILEPSHVPWGHKAFTAYLGADRQAWSAYDATALLASASQPVTMLIDQGGADSFLQPQLTSARFLAAAEAAGHSVTYRLQPDYDHSYYFVASFVPEHVAHHAEALRG